MYVGELVAGNECRSLRAVGQRLADLEAELGVFDHAVERPLRADLVARLMIMMRLVVDDLFAHPARWLVDRVGPRIDIQARYTDPSEAELVRAIEITAVRKLVGLDGAVLARRKL